MLVLVSTCTKPLASYFTQHFVREDPFDRVYKETQIFDGFTSRIIVLARGLTTIVDGPLAKHKIMNATSYRFLAAPAQLLAKKMKNISERLTGNCLVETVSTLVTTLFSSEKYGWIIS